MSLCTGTPCSVGCLWLLTVCFWSRRVDTWDFTLSEMQLILAMAPLFSRIFLCAYLGHAAAQLMVHTRSFISKFVSLISTSYGLLSILKVAYLWWKVNRYGLGYLGPQAICHCLRYPTSQSNETTTHPIILLEALMPKNPSASSKCFEQVQ